MKQEAFSLQSVSVRMNNHTVLKGIFVQLFCGETIGILFNNSDEKAAFIQLMMGNIPLHYGRVYFHNTLIHETDLTDEFSRNIYVVKNPGSLSRELTVYENLYYAQFHPFYINKKKYYRQALETLRKFRLNLDPARKASGLCRFEVTLLEIMKAYVRNCRIIVLANVTGALDQSEQQIIKGLMQQLKSVGFSFLIIGAFEEILFEETDSISIIQGGQTIGPYASREFDTASLHKLLYKYSLPVKQETFSDHKQKVFSFYNVSSNTLRNATFTLHKGEIIKVIYSDDASARDLECILKGNTRDCKGNVYLNQKLYHAADIQDALKSGMGFIEENPIEKMLFSNLTIIDNICYPLSNKVNGFWMRKKYQNSVKQALDGLLDPSYFRKSIKDVSVETLYLVLYCKWLLFMPKVLVCINPFSVADVQINQMIFEMLEYIKSRGIGVIILTSYWPSFCDIEGKVWYLEGGSVKGAVFIEKFT